MLLYSSCYKNKKNRHVVDRTQIIPFTALHSHWSFTYQVKVVVAAATLPLANAAAVAVRLGCHAR
jgi:hypothetical protein